MTAGVCLLFQANKTQSYTKNLKRKKKDQSQTFFSPFHLTNIQFISIWLSYIQATDFSPNRFSFGVVTSVYFFNLLLLSDCYIANTPTQTTTTFSTFTRT